MLVIALVIVLGIAIVGVSVIRGTTGPPITAPQPLIEQPLPPGYALWADDGQQLKDRQQLKRYFLQDWRVQPTQPSFLY